jgi:hypothetical protein
MRKILLFQAVLPLVMAAVYIVTWRYADAAYAVLNVEIAAAFLSFVIAGGLVVFAAALIGPLAALALSTAGIAALVALAASAAALVGATVLAVFAAVFATLAAVGSAFIAQKVFHPHSAHVTCVAHNLLWTASFFAASHHGLSLHGGIFVATGVVLPLALLVYEEWQSRAKKETAAC